MAITTYGELQAAVARFLRRSDLAADIPGFIALAEGQMNRRLRVRPMVQRATASLEAEYVQLPARFLGVRALSLQSAAPQALRFVTPERMDDLAATAASGAPQFYTVVGGELRLYPSPAAAVTGLLTYWQAIPALSDAAPSNWVLETHPDAYLYGALVQSAPFLKADERLAVWSGLFTQALAGIEASDQAESLGGALGVVASVGDWAVA